MEDVRTKGLKITKATSCRVGTHAFTWTGWWPEADLRCSCGLYTYREWKADVRGEKAPLEG